MTYCVLCAVDVDTVEFKPKSNFTAFNEIRNGDGICRDCNKLMLDRTSRQSSWILEGAKRTLFKRAEWLDVLRREKETPFVLYFTKSYKTQGFIPLLSRPNLNNDTYVVGLDRTVIRVIQAELPKLVAAGQQLRKSRWSKEEMLTRPKTERYMNMSDVETWYRVRSNQAWPLVVGGLPDLKPIEKDQSKKRRRSKR